MSRSSTSRLALFAGLAVSLAATPRPGGAAEPGRSARAKGVFFKPLFDQSRRFTLKKTFHLRFRARDRASGVPLAASDVSFTLRHDDLVVALPARELKAGVFEVPFTPEEPGPYAVMLAVRGAKEGSIAPVRLGVVGMAEGIIELPPEADADATRRSKGHLTR